MRIVGLDVGDKRIGVAVSDPLGWTAQPHSVIHRVSREKDLAAVLAVVEEYEAERIVVGLPQTLKGDTGPQAEKVQAFAAKLTKVSPVPVVFQDERLTTVEAENALIAADVSRARRRLVVDKVAAVLILDGYLRRTQGKE